MAEECFTEKTTDIQVLLKVSTKAKKIILEKIKTIFMRSSSGQMSLILRYILWDNLSLLKLGAVRLLMLKKIAKILNWGIKLNLRLKKDNTAEELSKSLNSRFVDSIFCVLMTSHMSVISMDGLLPKEGFWINPSSFTGICLLIFLKIWSFKSSSPTRFNTYPLKT